MTRTVGEMKKDGLCYILKEEADSEWVYVESAAVVRGFVKKAGLLTGDAAKKFVQEKKEENLLLAESLVDPLENAALTYTKTTVRPDSCGKGLRAGKRSGGIHPGGAKG